MVFKKIRDALVGSREEPSDADYLQVSEVDVSREETMPKVSVKLFILNQYDDVNKILNALREGYTIALVDIKPLRQKDSIELKRAVSKIKKTAEALNGSIAGHETFIVVTPSFAKISKEEAMVPEDKAKNKFDTY